MSGHWAYIAGAYGIGLLVLGVEVILLWRRTRQLAAQQPEPFPLAQGGAADET